LHMRTHIRLSVVVIALVLLTALVGCTSQLFTAPTPIPTPTPVRPLVPTFTPTPVPSPTSPAEGAPAPTQEVSAPPTGSTPAPQETPAQPPPPTPVPTQAAPPSPTATPTPYIVVDRARVNVRQGPGTNYPRLGQLQQGVEATIVGKDPSGEWWQICCVDGQEAWIAGWVVEAKGDTSGVPVAQNIPAPPPTATPVPTPLPTPTPRPSYIFNVSEGPIPLSSGTPVLTVWVKLADPDNNPIAGRTVRLLRGGATIAEKQSQDAFGYTRPSEDFGFFYKYNVKIEIPNPAPGEYEVVVVQGNQEISPRVKFVKSTDSAGAEFFIAFQSR